MQDPLKMAVAQFLQDTEIQTTLNNIAEQVEEKLREVSARTLEKIKEMDPEIANTLKPVIPSASNLKWADVFKSVSITADDDIPINKRGSGVKRLILLNFFRAEAERRMSLCDGTGVIYAIEAPETSQHFSNQKILAEALIQLSDAPNTQVILTTHSGVIVKALKCDDLRLVRRNANGEKEVGLAKSGLLGYTSLNEVNFTAFGEVTEEYHDELYGFIESNGLMGEYEAGKNTIQYIKIKRNGSTVTEPHTLTHYIRDVMHHPENTNNDRYTYEQLRQSILEMRAFIIGKNTIIYFDRGEDTCRYSADST